MAAKVMLSIRQCQCLLRTLSLRRSSVQIIEDKVVLYRHASQNQYSTSVQENTNTEENDELELQRELEAKRDVSRLPETMKIRLEHNLQVPEEDPDQRNPRRRHRKLYSYYGRASGIDPTVAWPTKEELDEEIEFENEFEPSLQERMASLQAEKEAEFAMRSAREKQVKKQMAKMPEYIAQYRAKLAKADAAEMEQENKRKAMMEEARDYFGFHIDPRDPRFKQMQEDKAEELQQLRKKKRKEEKELRMESTLKRMQMEAEKAKNKETES